jgi:Core-2/I-Branching enzyme.
MKKVYIIQAHKNPEQLRRLIDVLHDDSSTFYIHIDLKSNIEHFIKLINRERVVFIKERVNCIYADYSQVLATISLLKEAIRLPQPKDTRIIFLSGQDYPKKKLSEIDDFFNQNKEFDFTTFILDPISEKDDVFIDRIESYKINLSSKRADFILTRSFVTARIRGKLLLISLLLRGIISWQTFMEVFHPRISLFPKHYKGPQWFALKFNTAKKIIKYFSENERQLDEYYKYTLCADEQIFQTILKEIMKTDSSIQIKPYLHFVDWSRRHLGFPVTFTNEDFELINNQPTEKLFARKFDEEIDSEILDLIDNQIMGK